MQAPHCWNKFVWPPQPLSRSSFLFSLTALCVHYSCVFAVGTARAPVHSEGIPNFLLCRQTSLHNLRYILIAPNQCMVPSTRDVAARPSPFSRNKPPDSYQGTTETLLRFLSTRHGRAKLSQALAMRHESSSVVSALVTVFVQVVPHAEASSPTPRTKPSRAVKP